MARSAPSKNNGAQPLITDAAQVLREASRIERGEKPEEFLNEPARSGPANGPEAQGGGSPQGEPSPPVSLSIDQLAELACVLCDWPFVRQFGLDAQLPEPFSSQAKQAWVSAIALYLPDQIQKAGPLGVLATIYLGHAGALLLQWQMNAKSSRSSGNGAPVNRA